MLARQVSSGRIPVPRSLASLAARGAAIVSTPDSAASPSTAAAAFPLGFSSLRFGFPLALCRTALSISPRCPSSPQLLKMQCQALPPLSIKHHHTSDFRGVTEPQHGSDDQVPWQKGVPFPLLTAGTLKASQRPASSFVLHLQWSLAL